MTISKNMLRITSANNQNTEHKHQNPQDQADQASSCGLSHLNKNFSLVKTPKIYSRASPAHNSCPSPAVTSMGILLKYIRDHRAMRAVRKAAEIKIIQRFDANRSNKTPVSQLPRGWPAREANITRAIIFPRSFSGLMR